ncbi:intercellular adhesion molecule 5 isoform X1 [Astyanax mexicanus]|uniref:Intercellular adhesion molecule 5 isoform X1 n=1 Tax=Astyanax mexicanus TaxID=7994 RepID=A0A8T2MAY5_ASTMX|nr:intercellular adhesion molecule 5 isoform X1 [Astyanax mexicanus]
MLRLLLLKLMGLMLVGLVKGDCPITLHPAEVVVEHGASASANCSTSMPHKGMGWEASQGLVDMRENVQFITWSVKSIEEWDIAPFCYIIQEADQCQVSLPVTVYKIPDGVFISTVGHTGPMTEERQYELQCALQNVAPVGNVIVKWYKGDTQVGNTIFSESSKTPDNLLTTLQISPSRDDDGAQYRCKAELNLGPNGPQPPPAVMSDPLTTTVRYLCPITLHPAEVVVEHGASASANCSTSMPHKGMGWEASQGQVDMMENVQFITWSVKSIDEWDIAPFCYITQEADQCQVSLPVTVYKIPDGVFISTVGHTGPMTEGRQYELQCALQDVAPVGNVIVKWYKGDTLVGNTTFSESSKTPDNLLATLQISPSRDDDGAQYRCEAELNLGPKGPQPPPAVMSDPLNITVKYCPITLHPAEVVVEHGASASANCSTSMPHKGMGWEASQGQVDMIENVQFITWSVKSIEEWDIAPFCYITQEADQCGVSLPVTVYKIPDGVFISTVGHTGPMTEERQYELQCALQNVAPVGNVIVKWYKGDTQVGNTTFSESSKTPDNLLATLQISPSRDDDGAQYRCKAELNLGPKGPQPPPAVMSDPLTTTVRYKPVSACSNWSPVISTTLDSYPFPFVGNPPPRLTWNFRGSRVDPTKQLGKHDSGEYLYRAINILGIGSCSLNITVEYGPTFDCLKKYEGREHSLFSHDCTALASPVATVSWIKDGVNVQPPRNLTRRDNGSYIIRAKNKYGTVDHHLYLNVLYAPVIALKEESVAVYKGNAVSLLCKAEGNPEPEVIWRFNNQIKLTGKREAILNISGVTAADSGVYTCTAKNELGSQERRVEVLVAVKDYTIQIVPIIIVLVIIIILICIFVCLC